MKHVNIPIFIPHLGCPNKCVFCNQRTISGVQDFRAEDVRDIIETALSTVAADDEVEIAFFGGSFTGVDRELMIRLLEIAYSYISDGRVSAVRCSTRPDYIDEDILRILKQYGVKTVELGLQSIDNGVLVLTRRGHSFNDEEIACKLITEHGFSLVGQMMIGLPGSSPESEMRTAEFIISAGAVGARIYPTVVFCGTELCDMVKSGEYTPLTEEEAVVRSAAVMKRFIEAKTEIIRVGLCASENLASEDTYFAGPNHPALGELVESQIYFDIIKKKIQEKELSGKVPTVLVAKGSLSKAIGHKKKNKLRLMRELSLADIIFAECRGIAEYDAVVSVVER